jgi:hypothetical protein
MRNPLVPRWLCQLALPFAFGVLGARADEISSVYTSLNLEQCRDITPEDAKDYATVWRCKGYGGIDVRVAEGDLRIYVSYGPKAEQQTAAQATLPQFNTIGETLEWRLAEEGGSRAPFATILHFSWDVDGKKGSTLVVTKLDKRDACHVAYVEATGNPTANEQARAIADKAARGFACKRDTAKHYGADGKLLTDDQ